MARAPNAKAKEAYALYKKGFKLIDISKQLGLPEGTVRRWKSTYKWDTERSDKSERSHKRPGAQPGNKNSVGHASSAPEQNKNAEKHGFFSKYLPEETFAIIQQIDSKPPLDILWENIQIAYAAIIRAQNIMYVTDKTDSTTTQIARSDGDTSSSEKWEVQQAWDKQANFLKAQSRAQSELRGLIKAYDEMLHKNWELATEEQKARIAVLKAKANFDEGSTESDGFIKALEKMAVKSWGNE